MRRIVLRNAHLKVAFQSFKQKGTQNVLEVCIDNLMELNYVKKDILLLGPASTIFSR